MRKINLKFLFKQHAFSRLGAFKHTFGGATAWITMAIFLFSGIAAWNTPTMDMVRMYIPWLTFPVFIGIAVSGIAIMMWLEHFIVQSSMVLYWAKMFWNKGNPLRRHQEKMDRKIDQLAKTQGEILEAINKINEGHKG